MTKPLEAHRFPTNRSGLQAHVSPAPNLLLSPHQRFPFPFFLKGKQRLGGRKERFQCWENMRKNWCPKRNDLIPEGVGFFWAPVIFCLRLPIQNLQENLGRRSPCMVFFFLFWKSCMLRGSFCFVVAAAAGLCWMPKGRGWSRWKFCWDHLWHLLAFSAQLFSILSPLSFSYFFSKRKKKWK